MRPSWPNDDSTESHLSQSPRLSAQDQSQDPTTRAIASHKIQPMTGLRYPTSWAVVNKPPGEASRVRCQEVPYSSETPRGPEILLPQPGLDSLGFFVTLDRKARKTTIFTPGSSGAGDRSRC